MSFEQQFPKKPELTPRQKHEEFLRKQQISEYAAKKSKEILNNKRKELYSLSIEDSTKVMQKKIKFIEREKITKTEELKKLSNIFEAIFCDENTKGGDGWFGPDAYVVPSSEYDDFFNGIDNFAIFENKKNEEEMPPKILAMTTDLTFSTGACDVDKKLEKIKNEILGPIGETKIKYMPILNIPKNIYIPSFIIAVDKNTVEELTNKWVGKDDKNNEIQQQYKEKMSKHKIQFQILREILLQCEFFTNFAQKNNKNNIASAYEKIKVKINEIYNKKMQISGRKTESPSDTDGGYDELIKGLKNLDKPDKYTKVT